LAGWLMFREKGGLNPRLVALSKKAINDARMSAIERAQAILKNYPDLVPKVDATALRWPDETKLKWIQIFGGDPPAHQRWNPTFSLPKEVDDFLKECIGGFKF